MNNTIDSRHFLTVTTAGDGEKSRPYVEAVRPIYKLYGKPKARIELLIMGPATMYTRLQKKEPMTG